MGSCPSFLVPFVDWIFIDANMGLAVPPHVVIDATKSLLQYRVMDDLNNLTSNALEPIERWVVPWSTLNPQVWILGPSPCWWCWKPCYWLWITWLWCWSTCGWWRSTWLLEEELMTHYVVIQALIGSWYPRIRLDNPIGGSMMDRDP